VKILEDGVVKRRAVGDVRDDFVAVEYNGRD